MALLDMKMSFCVQELLPIYLKQNFDSENAGETVVEVGELLVPLAVRLDGVLASKGHRRHHYHLSLRGKENVSFSEKGVFNIHQSRSRQTPILTPLGLPQSHSGSKIKN